MSENLDKESVKPLFLKYLKKYKKNWVLGILAVVGSTGFGVLSPLILRRAIDDLKEGKPLKIILYNALLIVGVTAASGLFRFFMRETMIVTSRHIEYDIRNDIFLHLESLDRTFYHQTPTGDIMSKATNDLEAVRAMYGPGIMHSISTTLTLILAFVLMFHIDAVLAAYTIIPLPLLSITVLVLSKQVYMRYARIQKHYGKLSAYVQENLSGIRVIQAFVQESNQVHGFDKLNRDYIRKNMNMIKVWGLFFPVLSMIGGGLIVLLLLVGGKRVINGEITLGTFVAFMAYLLMLIWPMMALGWVIGLFQRGKVSLLRIKKIFDRKPLIVQPQDIAPVKVLKGGIEIKGLRFSYDPKSKAVLEDISFTVKTGDTVAIVGATGSGKTTLVSLLPKLYNVSDGMIYFDGVDINRLDLNILRSNIGFIPQESFLFSESIVENIAFGAEEKPSRMEIEEAAQLASLMGDINSFPKGFDTVIGEKGITLSGGQKQRLAIARAIVKRPPILVFDDAFSSVDTQTEEQILLNLRNIMRKTTVLLISHRISTVKNADIILVLDGGKLVEEGKHQQLLRLGGVYANIHKKQLIAEELETI